MREIGGYFGLDHLINNEYHKDLIALNTGRNALLYTLKSKEIKKIYIPSYLCTSVSEMLKMYKFDFEYYNIDSKFMPIFNKTLDENEYLYIVNYYGQIRNDTVILLNQKYSRIILDNTQAFFQKPLVGIDTLYSCRKFFGVPDGAYLSVDKKLDEELEEESSKDRMTHILGRFEGNASDYHKDFHINDASFKMEPLKYMSRLSKNILGAIDYDKVRHIRNENYCFLESKLKAQNKLKLTTSEGPFAYPFYIENGIEVRKVLAKKKIYIPILWPNVLNDLYEESIEYQYAENILPLPCDQRYLKNDMERLVEEIFKCIN